MIGETVTVRTRVQTGTDEGGNAVYAWSDQAVDGVLVAPGTTTDVAGNTRPDGVEVVFELHFPKTFTASLANARVVVRGETFQVIGDPKPYADDLTPGMWDRPVDVKAVDG